VLTFPIDSASSSILEELATSLEKTSPFKSSCLNPLLALASYLEGTSYASGRPHSSSEPSVTSYSPETEKNKPFYSRLTFGMINP